MSEKNWTPGPWEFAPVGAVDFRKPEREDFMIVDAEMCCVGILWGHVWKPGLPNAHLIRTAPELYEALEYAIAQVPELASVPGIAAAMLRARGAQ